jgi:hypothetical protein
MSERNPPRLPSYSPHREYDSHVRVLVFRDVPEDDWLTAPRALDPGAWAAGIHEAQQRTHQLAGMPYRDYLQSDEWRRLRSLVIDRAAGRCERCRKTADEWNVHHLTYERRGHELLEDLVLLCRPCHMAEHGITD